MNILDTPYIVEIFFVISTIVFGIALYAILPALIYRKRTLFKPLFINALWQKYMKNIFVGIRRTSFPPKKKEIKSLILTIYNG